MDLADRWLHEQRLSIETWRGGRHDGGVEESVQRAVAGAQALEAAGVLTPASAARWRALFAADARGEVRPSPGEEVRRHAERFLAGLREKLPQDPEWDDADAQRYEAAVHLLSAVGAVERGAWPSEEDEDEEAEPAVYPGSQAGGTETELTAVLAGPPEVRRGYRVMLVLRFADGVSFLVDRDPAEAPDVDWPEWSLTDDLGTAYWPDGGGGGSEEEHVSFGTAIPERAKWVELVLEDRPDVRLRVTLG